MSVIHGIDEKLKDDRGPNIPDRIVVSEIKREILKRRDSKRWFNPIKGSVLGSISLLGTFFAILMIFLNTQSNVVYATLTPLGRMTVVHNSPAKNLLTSMKINAVSASENPKVSSQTIIDNLVKDNYFGTQKSTSIVAYHCVLSRIPKELVNPSVLKSDPTIKVSGDYLNNVQAWVITFEGVHPPVTGGIGIKVKAPSSVNEVFDANTGQVIMGFD